MAVQHTHNHCQCYVIMIIIDPTHKAPPTILCRILILILLVAAGTDYGTFLYWVVLPYSLAQEGNVFLICSHCLGFLLHEFFFFFFHEFGFVVNLKIK